MDYFIAIKEFGPFNVIRKFNRRRNYLTKHLRYNAQLCYSMLRWRRKERRETPVSQVNTILLIRNDGKTGDAVVSTCLLKSLFMGGIKTDVLATKSNAPVFRHNPWVRKLYLSEDIELQQSDDRYAHFIPDVLVNILKSNHYDLIIDTSLWETGFYMARLIKEINPALTLGFNKPDWLNIYDINIKFDFYNNHTSKIYPAILEALNLQPLSPLKYEVFLPEKIKNEVIKLGIIAEQKQNIVINIYASHKDRYLSLTQLEQIIAGINQKEKRANIIVLDYKKEITLTGFSNVVVYQNPTLYHAFATIDLTDLVITPDTAIVHIAACYDKPLIAVYLNNAANNFCWSPGYDKGIQIFSTAKRFSEDPTIVDNILALI